MLTADKEEDGGNLNGALEQGEGGGDEGLTTDEILLEADTTKEELRSLRDAGHYLIKL